MRKGVEQLTALFPVEASYFDFVIENDGRTTKYKLNAQSLRLFGLRNNDDAKDVHRAGANRLKKWQKKMTWASSSSSSWQQWSSDQTRERSGWRSSVSWQSPFSRQ